MPDGLSFTTGAAPRIIVIEPVRVAVRHSCVGKPHALMNNKNITRYTYESTDFQGWRVSIQRRGRIITRYFSDLQCGSEEEAHRQALEYRDHIFSQMAANRNNLEEFMDRELENVQQLLREKERGYSAGL